MAMAMVAPTSVMPPLNVVGKAVVVVVVSAASAATNKAFFSTTDTSRGAARLESKRIKKN